MRYDEKLHVLERAAPVLSHKLVDMPMLLSKSRARDPYREAWVPRRPMTMYTTRGIVGTVLPNPYLQGRHSQYSEALQPRQSDALVPPVLVRTV